MSAMPLLRRLLNGIFWLDNRHSEIKKLALSQKGMHNLSRHILSVTCKFSNSIRVTSSINLTEWLQFRRHILFSAFVNNCIGIYIGLHQKFLAFFKRWRLNKWFLFTHNWYLWYIYAKSEWEKTQYDQQRIYVLFMEKKGTLNSDVDFLIWKTEKVSAGLSSLMMSKSND